MIVIIVQMGAKSSSSWYDNGADCTVPRHPLYLVNNVLSQHASLSGVPRDVLSLIADYTTAAPCFLLLGGTLVLGAESKNMTGGQILALRDRLVSKAKGTPEDPARIWSCYPATPLHHDDPASSSSSVASPRVTGSAVSVSSRDHGPITASSTNSTTVAVSSEWRDDNLAPLPEDRSGMTAGVFNGDIYVAGGLFTSSISQTVIRYSIADNKWSKSVASLPERRFGPTAAVVNGHWVLCGKISCLLSFLFFVSALADMYLCMHTCRWDDNGRNGER
jgi:hypothetical protein